MTPRSSLTEETAATPSWVETRLDAIIAALPAPAAGAMWAERDGYLDCLAGTAGPGDPLLGQQRCHQAVLRRLRADGLDAAATARLHEQLEALEAELAAGT